MAGSVLQKNMEVLKPHLSAYKVVSQAIKTTIANEYRIEQSKKGEPTLIVCKADERPLTYHSKYDPVKEAARQVDASYKNESHVVMSGFGMGYVADRLYELIPAGGKCFVIEPDISVFISALKARDLTKLLKCEKFIWCIGQSPDEIGDEWNSKLDWSEMNKLAFVEHPVSIARFKKYFERIMEKIRYLCNKSKGNLVTIMHAGYDFLSNYFENIAASFALPGINRLFNKFNNVPAVLVAAGPSLDKNMHLLKKVKGKFPIIAVDTALRQLATQGIKPDIACAADPSYENSLDFVGMENEKEIILGVEPMTHPDIFQSYTGPKMLMSFGSGIHSIIQPYREPIGTVSCWGSIATTIFDLAKKIGANPIIFIGLDLSFQDGKLHAKGSYSDDLLYESVHDYTSVEHETAEYVNTRGAYKIKHADGTVVYTDQNMKVYKDWFEDQFRQTKQTIINATEGGIVNNHITNMAFEQAIEKYSNYSCDVNNIISQAISTTVDADYKGLIQKLKLYRKTMIKHGDMARKKVSQIKKLISSYPNNKPSTLAGVAKVEFNDILQLHDDICSEKEIFSWFSIYQAKFMTRHTTKISSLNKDNNAQLKQWLDQLMEFFVALDKFHEYQLPLLDRAITSLGEADKSKSTKWGVGYE